ncbi:MAG TPA: MOSC domain-containing protein [Nocardioidaceae bacterium]|nr:MOSC domain-containing protein [Nocardioidaceae bacterium]
MTTYRTAAELAAFESELRLAPKDVGSVELVVSRPVEGKREVLDVGRLTFADGLEGDSWRSRGRAHVDSQINVMSARMAAFLAVDPRRRALAGDQLFIDLDLSHENLPAGARLAVGDAVIEVSRKPHNGCAKFVRRFGQDAMEFVNSPLGQSLRLRGFNARVVVEGEVRPGDKVVRLAETLEL